MHGRFKQKICSLNLSNIMGRLLLFCFVGAGARFEDRGMPLTSRNYGAKFIYMGIYKIVITRLKLKPYVPLECY